MNNLNTLLRDASADAPPDHLDLEAIVGAGRARVRRRRAVAGIAAAAVVGLVAGVAVVGSGGTENPSPAANGVQVLSLDDAKPAREARDYEVLRTFTAHSSDEAMEGDFVRGVLPDGRVVTQRYPDGWRGVSEIAIVGPKGTRKVEAPTDLGNYLGSASRMLVFGGDLGFGLWILDPDNLEWRQLLEGHGLDTNTPAQPITQGSATNRIYLPAGFSAQGEPRPLYQLNLDRSSATEVGQGGLLGAHGDQMAWTGAYDAPVPQVMVGSPDGPSTRFDPHTGGCVGKELGFTADRIVLMTNCADEAGDNEETDVVDRIDVFDLDGRPLARITGDDLGPVRMTEAYLTISSWNEEQAGTYTYDLSDGEFLRMTDAMSGLAGHETGSGSILVWEERVDGDSGARYVVARMR